MYRVFGMLLIIAAVFLGLAILCVVLGAARHYKTRRRARQYPRLAALGHQIQETPTVHSEPPTEAPKAPLPQGEHADRPWPPALPEPAPHVLDDTKQMDDITDVFEQEYPIFKVDPGG